MVGRPDEATREKKKKKGRNDGYRRVQVSHKVYIKMETRIKHKQTVKITEQGGLADANVDGCEGDMRRTGVRGAKSCTRRVRVRIARTRSSSSQPPTRSGPPTSRSYLSTRGDSCRAPPAFSFSLPSVVKSTFIHQKGCRTTSTTNCIGPQRTPQTSPKLNHLHKYTAWFHQCWVHCYCSSIQYPRKRSTSTLLHTGRPKNDPRKTNTPGATLVVSLFRDPFEG